jgi:hypothetical protein
MELEQQVTSLELSKRLCELGVKQESLFYHHWYKKNRDYERIEHTIEKEYSESFDDNKWKFECYAAFTASELLELLPNEISNNDIYYTYLMIFKKNNEYEIRYDSMNIDRISHIKFGRTLPNALAKMLIYFIENKLLEIK